VGDFAASVLDEQVDRDGPGKTLFVDGTANEVLMSLFSGSGPDRSMTTGLAGDLLATGSGASREDIGGVGGGASVAPTPLMIFVPSRILGTGGEVWS
jgi:hypothetical protein